ncbi:MAG: LysE family translocator [Alphaproteobacteria bacterium]
MIFEVVDSVGLAVATLIFVFSPGAGVLALLAVGLRQGWQAAITLATGLIVADMFYLLLALFGLGLVGNYLPSILQTARIVGALYLVYLGIVTCRAAPPTQIDQVQKRSHLVLFAAGFGISITNPKVVLFYLGFLPAFVDLERVSISVAAWVVFVVVSMLYVGCWFYALACHHARTILLDPRRGQMVQYISGLLMMLAACWIIFV